jgi:hypothetical protein
MLTLIIRTTRSFNPVSREGRKVLQNYNDNQRYLKNRGMPDDVGSELHGKVSLHKGYKGLLDMIKNESDDEQEGRSLVQELDYSDKMKAAK